MGFLEKVFGLKTQEEKKREKLVAKAIALEEIRRNLEGQSMDPVEMLAWRQILMPASRIHTSIFDDPDSTREYVEAAMKKKPRT